MLDKAVAQAEELAIADLGFGGLSASTPAQADRVGQFDPVAANDNLDHEEEGERSDGAPGDRSPAWQRQINAPRIGVESGAASWANSGILARDVSLTEKFGTIGGDIAVIR